MVPITVGADINPGDNTEREHGVDYWRRRRIYGSGVSLLGAGRLKMRDWKYRQQTAGVENAGPSSYGKPKHLIHFGIKYASRS